MLASMTVLNSCIKCSTFVSKLFKFFENNIPHSSLVAMITTQTNKDCIINWDVQDCSILSSYLNIYNKKFFRSSLSVTGFKILRVRKHCISKIQTSCGLRLKSEHPKT